MPQRDTLTTFPGDGFRQAKLMEMFCARARVAEAKSRIIGQTTRSIKLREDDLSE